MNSRLAGPCLILFARQRPCGGCNGFSNANNMGTFWFVWFSQSSLYQPATSWGSVVAWAKYITSKPGLDLIYYAHCGTDVVPGHTQSTCQCIWLVFLIDIEDGFFVICCFWIYGRMYETLHRRNMAGQKIEWLVEAVWRKTGWMLSSVSIFISFALRSCPSTPCSPPSLRAHWFFDICFLCWLVI